LFKLRRGDSITEKADNLRNLTALFGQRVSFSKATNSTTLAEDQSLCTKQRKAKRFVVVRSCGSADIAGIGVVHLGVYILYAVIVRLGGDYRLLIFLGRAL